MTTAFFVVADIARGTAWIEEDCGGSRPDTRAYNTIWKENLSENSAIGELLSLGEKGFDIPLQCTVVGSALTQL